MKRKHRYSRSCDRCILCGLGRIDIVRRQLGCYKWVLKTQPMNYDMFSESMSYYAQKLKGKFLDLLRKNKRTKNN